MTTQISEKLTYNGRDYYMRDFPLPVDKLREGGLVPNGNLNSGCWRGYIGHWAIEDDRLMLKSMDLLGFEDKPFADIFKEATEQGLAADWVNGELVCDTGDVIRRDIIQTVFAHTTTFTIENGRVVSVDERENE